MAASERVVTLDRSKVEWHGNWDGRGAVVCSGKGSYIKTRIVGWQSYWGDFQECGEKEDEHKHDGCLGWMGGDERKKGRQRRGVMEL
jgi:hypothetical protein